MKTHIMRLSDLTPDISDEQMQFWVDRAVEMGYGEVWLFSAMYMPSFYSLDWYREYAVCMKRWIAMFKEAGIRPCINMLQTTGHVFYPHEHDERFPFQRKWSIDGVESSASACPLCENLTKYVREVYKIFANLGAEKIYVDDDFRFTLSNGINCACPLHMAALSKKIGREIKHEELFEIFSNPSHKDHFSMRKDFQEVLVDSLVQLATNIREAVDEVNPGLPIGFMAAFAPYGWWGKDFERVGRALAGPNNPIDIRPQIDVYEEGPLKRILGAARQPAIVRETLPEGTVICPELEAFPYTTWARSRALLKLQSIMVHLDGMHNLAYTNTFFQEDLDPNITLLGDLKNDKNLYETLIDTIKEGTRSCGVSIPLHKNFVTSCNMRYPEQSPDVMLCTDAYDCLAYFGIPIGFDWYGKSQPTLRIGKYMDDITDEQFEKMLDGGVVFDMDAVEALVARGFGKRLGLSLGEPVLLEKSNKEYLTDDQLNGATVNTPHYVGHAIFNDGWAKKIIADGNVRVLSNLYDADNQLVTPLIFAKETEDGKRFAVIGFPLSNPDYSAKDILRVQHRKNQFVNLFEWVSQKKLPVFIDYFPYLSPMLTPICENESVLGLCNGSTDIYSNINIHFEKGAPKRVEILCDNGKWKKAKVKKTQDGFIWTKQILPSCATVLKLYY